MAFLQSSEGFIRHQSIVRLKFFIQETHFKCCNKYFTTKTVIFVETNMDVGLEGKRNFTSFHGVIIININ